MRKLVLLGWALVFLCVSPLPGADVLTQRNDNGRTSLNLSETVLTPSSFKSNGLFGKLYSRALDADAYAQPLYVSDLDINGRNWNVIFVATENNSVYAFDDDVTVANAEPFWHENLGPAIPTAELSHDLHVTPDGCPNLTTEVGITGTPVIDRSNNVLYVVAKTKSMGQYTQFLCGLDLRTGAVLRKTVIQGSLPGRGPGSERGQIEFKPLLELNRPGLLLDHGILYIAFGSHGSIGSYHGWVFAYDASDFKLDATFITTPNTTGKYDGQGGIWQSGTGPAADGEGNVYLTVGNGGCDPQVGDYGDSLLKLRLQHGRFSVRGFFAPADEEILKIQDADFGSTGPLLIPGTSLIAIGCKEGKLSMLDYKAMKGRSRTLEEVQVTPLPHYFGSPTNFGSIRYWHIHGTPVAYAAGATRYIYICGEEDPVRAYRMERGNSNSAWHIGPSSTATSDERPAFPPERAVMTKPAASNPDVWMPGGFLTISANGSVPNTAILWALMPLDGNANSRVVHGVLRAFDPVNFVRRPDGSLKIPQLWSSDHDANQSADSLGMYPKFSTPTIANGHVVVTTFNEEVVDTDGVHAIKPDGLHATLTVYGLRPTPPSGKDTASEQFH